MFDGYTCSEQRQRRRMKRGGWGEEKRRNKGRKMDGCLSKVGKEGGRREVGGENEKRTGEGRGRGRGRQS